MKGLAERIGKFAASEPELATAVALAREGGCRILLIGGAVRDVALGRPVLDLDFMIAGPAGRFLSSLARALRHRVVTFRKRGIVDHRIRAGSREWDFVECGRRTIKAEILRRDFTLNAVAWDPRTGRLLDPSGGSRDLLRRRIRAVSEGIFRDDPLRMLRAVRLRAEIPGLAIERRTAALIRRDAHLLPRVSAERIKAELDRILAAPFPSRSVRILERLGLLRQALPELDPLRGLRQNRYHHLDAFRHTLEALAAADEPRSLARRLPPLVFMTDPAGADPSLLPSAEAGFGALRGTHAIPPLAGEAPGAAPAGGSREPGWRGASTGGDTAPSRARAPRELDPGRARLLRWALLLHDTGKAATRTLGEDGDYHFFLHEQASARIARGTLRRLRASREEVAGVEKLVFLHLRLSIPASGGLSPRALRRIVRDAGSLTPLLVLHSLADKLASRGTGHSRTLAAIRRAGGELLQTWKIEVERARREPRFLDGHDVMRIVGMLPGPDVGELLAEMEELQASGGLRSREAALAWLERRPRPKPGR